jgi:hypothetical protein
VCVCAVVSAVGGRGRGAAQAAGAHDSVGHGRGGRRTGGGSPGLCGPVARDAQIGDGRRGCGWCRGAGSLPTLYGSRLTAAFRELQAADG